MSKPCLLIIIIKPQAGHLHCFAEEVNRPPGCQILLPVECGCGRKGQARTPGNVSPVWYEPPLPIFSRYPLTKIPLIFSPALITIRLGRQSGKPNPDEAAAAAVDLNTGGGQERGTTSVEAESASDPGGGERGEGESTVETLEEGRPGFVGSSGADRAHKPEIDTAEEGGVAGSDRVSGTVVPEGADAGIEAEGSGNGIGMELLGEKVAGFEEKGQGDVANEVKEHDLVVGCFQDTEVGHLGSRGQEMGDGSSGDQDLIADASETGNLLGKAKAEGCESVADLGGNQEEVVEVRNGTKLIKEDESCPEKTANAMNDVRSGDLVDGKARANNVGPGELVVVDELGGDQKLKLDVQAGSVMGVAEAATTGFGGAVEVDGLESEPANRGKIDVMETGLKEDELCIEKEQRIANDVIGHDLVDKHHQDKEGVLGLEALETENGLGSKQKSEINVANGENVVEYEEGTELMKKQITNQNLDCEVRGQDLVDERLQAPEGDVGSIALEAENELCSEEKLEANVSNAGFGVETAQTHTTVALARENLEGVAGLGQIQVGVAEFSNQIELTEGGLSCPEEDKSAVGEVTDLQAAEGALGPEVVETENILDGHQRPEPGVVEVGCLTDLGRAEHKVVETSNGTELTEQGVSCPQKNQCLVTEKGGHDLAYIHLQALEGDSSQNQSVNVEGSAGTKDMDVGLSMVINQVSQAWPTGCESEVVEGSMVSGDQEKDLKASVSQTSLVVTNQNDQEAGYAIREEETKADLLPVGDGMVEQADHFTKDSDLADSGVEVSNPDSYQVNDHPVDGGQIVTADVKASLAKCVADAALSADERLTNGNARDRLDIITADGNSVLDATIMESESRGMKLVDENSSDKGDITMANSCPDLESDFAGTCPLGVTAETCPLDSVLKDPESAVAAGLPMTSELSISQQSKIVERIFGKNQETESQFIGLLADRSDDAVIHEAESSPGICQEMDMESRVCKDETALTEACHEKGVLVRDFGDDKKTPFLVESAANIVIGAGDTAEQNVQVNEQEHSKIAENQVVKQVGIRPGTSGAEDDQHARYFVHLQDKVTFSISDLVWGKVKSHPWWPGQIFDPSDASDLAMKYQKKDNFLVAYFGDKTFAWCEEHQLKPFQMYFSQMEKQSTSDAFANAVNDALGEVSRRIELGMTCFCLPEETYANIKHQTVDNAGIREGFSSSVFDRSLVVDYFEPDRLLEYIKALAQLPNGVANKLELVIAQAQLKAFYRSKGYPELPVFQIGGGLMENDAGVSPPDGKLFGKDIIAHSTPIPMEPNLGMRKRGRGRPSNKEKQMLEDAKKQKNLSELMEKDIVSPLANGKIGSAVKVDDDLISHSSVKKRKNIDFDSDCSERSKKKRLDSLGDLVMKSPSPTPSSFKVGECIRRVASQLTGSPPILRCHGETFQKSVSKAEHGRFDVVDTEAVVETEASTHTAVENPRRKKGISEDYSSLDEMLSQLCLAARDPMKGYSFLSKVISYFTDFRNFCASTSSKGKKNSQKNGGKRGRKRTINYQPPSSDASTPDHMQDSYWSDMIYHNSSANDLKRKGDTHVRSQRKRRKSGRETPLSLPLDRMSGTARPLEVGTISPQMKQALTTERSVISLEEKIVDECTPTALILSFNGSSSLPSQTDLIRIFSRYGPLKETETEVQRKTNRVKVVFKKRADAEIAFSSAGKFSIFGPALLSYCLRYLLSPDASPDTTPQGNNDAGSVEGGKLEVPNEASPNPPSQGKNDAVFIEWGNSEVPGDASPNTTTPDKNDVVPIEGDNIGVPGDASPNTTPQIENDAVPNESCNLEVPGSVAPDIAPQNKNDAVHIEGGNLEIPGSIPNTTQPNNDSAPAECGNLEVPDDTYPNTTQGKKDAAPIEDGSLEVPGNPSPNATTQHKNDAALIENGSLDVPGNTSPSTTTQDKNDLAPIEDDNLGIPGNTYPNTTKQDKNDAALVEGVNLEVPGKAEIIVVSDVMQVEVVDKGSVEGIVQVDTQSG